MQEQFPISEGVDISASNYTITYSVSDSIHERRCDSFTIQASACTTGQRSHTFDVPSACFNANNIMFIVVTVFLSNVLGDGPSSEPFYLKLSKLINFFILPYNVIQ